MKPFSRPISHLTAWAGIKPGPFLLFCFLKYLTSCSTVQIPDVSKYYRKEIPITVKWAGGSQSFSGFGVIPLKPEYEISVSSKNIKSNRAILQTCHRDIQIDSESNSYSWKVRPVDGVEDQICPFEITVLDKDGKNQFGLLVIDNGKSEPLVASLNCNGVAFNSQRVSICHHKAGLIQKISFQEPATSTGNCFASQTANEFEIISKRGLCVEHFVSNKNPDLVHMIVFWGFDQ